MGTKNNPSGFDCYANADPDEQMFILLGRDRHGPALVRLWALMREKEGENPEIVREARQCADAMEAQGRHRGRAVLSLDALLTMCASLKPEAAAPGAEPGAERGISEIAEGDIVSSGIGVPMRLVRIFPKDEATDKRLHGRALCLLPKAVNPIDVEYATLRRAQPAEVERYRELGGK